MSRIKTLSNKISRLNNRYLVVKDFIAFLFFVLAGFVMSPVARDSEAMKLFMVLVYSLISFLGLLLITEFIVRTLRLQSETKVKRYSAIVSLNSIFGLVLPLWFVNYFVMRAIELMSRMGNYSTFICEIRLAFVDFYYSTDIYQLVNSVILASMVIAIAAFIFGGIWERGRK